MSGKSPSSYGPTIIYTHSRHTHERTRCRKVLATLFRRARLHFVRKVRDTRSIRHARATSKVYDKMSASRQEREPGRRRACSLRDTLRLSRIHRFIFDLCSITRATSTRVAFSPSPVNAKRTLRVVATERTRIARRTN